MDIHYFLKRLRSGDFSRSVGAQAPYASCPRLAAASSALASFCDCAAAGPKAPSPNVYLCRPDTWVTVGEGSEVGLEYSFLIRLKISEFLKNSEIWHQQVGAPEPCAPRRRKENRMSERREDPRYGGGLGKLKRPEGSWKCHNPLRKPSGRPSGWSFRLLPNSASITF